MVQVNFAKREVQCKIVYYGPAESGKTANLRSIHERTPEHVRGALTTISTDTDRTLFFDYLPLHLGAVAGISTKINVYAVPYIEHQNAVRLLVLEGVDGIVFVASSARADLDANREALENLRTNLAGFGRDLEDVPLVFQWNKSDASDALSPEELAAALNPDCHFASPAVATEGVGVFTTMKAISQRVIENVTTMMAAQPAAAAVPEPPPAPVPVPVPQPEPEPEPELEPALQLPTEPQLPPPVVEDYGQRGRPLEFEEVALPSEEELPAPAPPVPASGVPSWKTGRPPEEVEAPAPTPPPAIVSAAEDLERTSTSTSTRTRDLEPFLSRGGQGHGWKGAGDEEPPPLAPPGDPEPGSWDGVEIVDESLEERSRARRGYAVDPVVERRRKPRIADRSHVIPATAMAAGALIALFSLITIGYLVHALL
jgi:signal recognition particle receptor subunit beta